MLVVLSVSRASVSTTVASSTFSVSVPCSALSTALAVETADVVVSDRKLLDVLATVPVGGSSFTPDRTGVVIDASFLGLVTTAVIDVSVAFTVGSFSGEVRGRPEEPTRSTEPSCTSVTGLRLMRGATDVSVSFSSTTELDGTVVAFALGPSTSS
ncbi:MAG TPA: hypothetical protein PL070_14125 [Flavobacteriales bacterium]|nr:hypothetical protein [Flavobacteriales bacterium]